MPKAAKTNTTDWLLTGDEPEQDVLAVTANEQAMLRLVRKIPWKHQRSLIAAMRVIARVHRKEG